MLFLIKFYFLISIKAPPIKKAIIITHNIGMALPMNNPPITFKAIIPPKTKSVYFKIFIFL